MSCEQLNNLTQLEKLFGSRVGQERRRRRAFRRGLRRSRRRRDRNAVVRTGRGRAGRKGIDEGGRAARQRPRPSRLGDRRQGDEASRRDEDAREGRPSDGARVEPPRGARVRTPSDRCVEAVERADELIEQSLALLTKLIAVKQTMERASLIGSAYKRRALVDGAAGRRTRIQQDLRQMKAAYRGCAGRRREERRLGPVLSRVESSRRRRGPARRQASMAQSRSRDRRDPPEESAGKERHRPGLLERRRRNRAATSTRRWPRGSSRPPASNWTRPTRICTNA